MKGIFKRNQIMITALAIMLAIAGYLNFTGNKLESSDLATANSDNVTNDTIDQANANLADSDDYLALDISDEDLDGDGLADINSLDTDIDMAGTDLENGTAEVADADLFTVTDSAQASAGTASSEVANSELESGEIPGEAVLISNPSVNTLSSAKLLKEQTRAKNKETLLEIINSDKLDNNQKQDAINSMLNLTSIAEKEMAAEVLLESKGFTSAIVSIGEGSVDVIVNAAQLSDAKRAQIEDIVKRKTGVAAENIVISPMGE